MQAFIHSQILTEHVLCAEHGTWHREGGGANEVDISSLPCRVSYDDEMHRIQDGR